MKKHLLVFFVLSVLVLSFAAISNPDTIIKREIGEPQTLDPAYAYDTASGEVIFNIAENLIAYDGEALDEFIPMLSTVVPTVENGYLSEDGLTYTFVIREGVTFQNGNALTPEDVEYSFERNMLASQFGGPTWMYLEPLTGYQFLEQSVPPFVGVNEWSDLFNEDGTVKEEYKEDLIAFYEEVIDPAVEVNGQEVTFNLEIPYGPFLNVLAHFSAWSVILDKDWSIEQGAWDGNPDGWWKWHDLRTEDTTFYDNIMGTGPYELVEWDRTTQQVIMKRNENYWGDPAPVENVVLRSITEWSTAKTAFEAGDIDIMTPDQQYMSQLRGREDEGIITVEGLTTLSTDVIGFIWGINPDSKYIGSGRLDGEGIPTNFFADENVRKGFQHAFSYDAYIENVLEGQAIQPASALPQGLLGYNEDLYKPSFDIDAATNYFRRAFRGQLWNRGFKMSLIYNSGNDARQSAMEILRDNLAQINPKFQVEVRGVQWPDYVASRRSYTNPTNFFSWLADYPDPHNFISTYYNSDSGYYAAYMGDSYARFAKLPQPEFGGVSLNDYIMMALEETNTQKRGMMYEKISEFAVEHAVNLPVDQVLARKAYRDWLKGWERNPMQGNSDYFYQLSKTE